MEACRYASYDFQWAVEALETTCIFLLIDVIQCWTTCHYFLPLSSTWFTTELSRAEVLHTVFGFMHSVVLVQENWAWSKLEGCSFIAEIQLLSNWLWFSLAWVWVHLPFPNTWTGSIIALCDEDCFMATVYIPLSSELWDSRMWQRFFCLGS